MKLEASVMRAVYQYISYPFNTISRLASRAGIGKAMFHIELPS